MSISNEIGWHFDTFKQINGFKTGNNETFKNDALINSLAREVVQNSIDAGKKDGSRVRVEFSSFSLKRGEVPGFDDLENQIIQAEKLWRNRKDKETYEIIKNMKSHLNDSRFDCLRISDFGTTGLQGVENDDLNSDDPFHNLIFASGTSSKDDESGGSKGVGKYATFLNSVFYTTFYYTKTIDNKCGYVGMANLCSAPIEGGKNVYTHGLGYFARTTDNIPIRTPFSLDRDFERGSEPGTDLFIIGFNGDDNWVSDLITKILESFMCAIMYDTLEVSVEGVEINKQTVKDIVFDEYYVNPKKQLGKSAIAQYILLSGTDSVSVSELDLNLGYETGDIRLYTMPCSEKDSDLAINSCIFVRYPYMKIRTITLGSLPVNALCVIEKGKLLNMLRSAENPQHTDWSFSRIAKPKRKEAQEAYKTLVDEIKNYVMNIYYSSSSDQTDLYNAGKYLPLEDNNGYVPNDNTSENATADIPKVQHRLYKVKHSNLSARIQDDIGDGLIMDLADPSEYGDEVAVAPDSHNNSNTGGEKIGDMPIQVSEGDTIMPKSMNSRSTKINFMCLNRKEGEYLVSFVSDCTTDNACLEVYVRDESTGRYRVNVFKAFVNGEIAHISDNHIVNVSIEKGKKYEFDLYTDQYELFSAEVFLYESKR